MKHLLQHMPDGEVYALITDNADKPILLSGPLHYTELDAEESQYDGEPENLEWYEENKEEFQSYE